MAAVLVFDYLWTRIAQVTSCSFNAALANSNMVQLQHGTIPTSKSCYAQGSSFGHVNTVQCAEKIVSVCLYASSVWAERAGCEGVCYLNGDIFVAAAGWLAPGGPILSFIAWIGEIPFPHSGAPFLPLKAFRFWTGVHYLRSWTINTVSGCG